MDLPEVHSWWPVLLDFPILHQIDPLVVRYPSVCGHLAWHVQVKFQLSSSYVRAAAVARVSKSFCSSLVSSFQKRNSICEMANFTNLYSLLVLSKKCPPVSEWTNQHIFLDGIVNVYRSSKSCHGYRFWVVMVWRPEHSWWQTWHEVTLWATCGHMHVVSFVLYFKASRYVIIYSSIFITVYVQTYVSLAVFTPGELSIMWFHRVLAALMGHNFVHSSSSSSSSPSSSSSSSSWSSLWSSWSSLSWSSLWSSWSSLSWSSWSSSWTLSPPSLGLDVDM